MRCSDKEVFIQRISLKHTSRHVSEYLHTFICAKQRTATVGRRCLQFAPEPEIAALILLKIQLDLGTQSV